MTIKMDEEDNYEVGFQIDDDEENITIRVFDEDLASNNDTDSVNSNEDNDVVVPTPSWPQSYRQSMDMLTSVTPPSMSFLRQLSESNRSLSLNKRHWNNNDDDDSDLKTSLISKTISSVTQQDDHHQPPATSINGGTRNNSLDKSRLSNYTKYSSCDELPPPLEQSSISQSVLNGTNVLCGIGLLTTPYAVKEGGWLSLIILLFFSVICCYTGILLKRCLESSPRLHTYPDIGQAAFGVAGRFGIALFLYMELYFACVEFMILMSDNLTSLFPNTHMHIGGIINLSTRHFFTIASALCLLPTICLRNFKVLSILSVGGVASSILVTSCLIWVGAIDKVGFHPTGNAINLTNIPVVIGLYSFCFAGHSVFPNIYSSMKEPSKFPLVLTISFGFCIIIYIGVAVLGYLTFGDSIHSQFTLNMPKELAASNIAAWTTVMSPLTKYALTLMPVALSIEELLPYGRLRCYSVSILIRIALVFSNLVLALTIPFFGSIMAFMGSFMAMLVALIYPCACYLKLYRGKLSKLEVASCVFIIFMGAVCSIIGTYSAISSIADQAISE